MNVLRAITGSGTPKMRRTVVCALSAGTGAVWVFMASVIMLSLRESGGGLSKASWDNHRAEIRKLPEDLYHRDRFRAIRGRVTDSEGQPVSGALVRCVKVESLVELAKAGTPHASGWNFPVEAEITTGTDGGYEFPHLPVGAHILLFGSGTGPGAGDQGPRGRPGWPGGAA